MINPPLSFCQTRWTLAECIKYGQEKSLDIESGNIESQKNRNEYRASYLELLPAIQSSGGWAHQTTDIYSHNIVVSHTIFNGLKKLNKIGYYRSNTSYCTSTLMELMDEVKISITKAYYDVLMALEMVNIAKEGYKSIEEQYLLTTILFENGKNTYSSLLEMESQKSSEKAALINASNILSSSIITLVQLMNYPEYENFTISPSPSDTSMGRQLFYKSDSLLRRALTLPYISSAKLNIQRQKQLLKMATGDLFPNLSLDMGYDMKNEISSIALTLTIPLFNQGRTATHIKNTKLDIRAAEIELERREKELRKRVTAALQEASYCYQEYLAKKDQVRAIHESFVYIRERLNRGLSTPFEYNQSKNNLNKARAEKIQAKYRYLFQLKLIDHYQGETNWK